tara:strand:+ start:213 stop:518 length:306 start_codon:yes stop_codon:yes gene_type:complete
MIHPQNSLIGHSDSAATVYANTQKWGWALVDPFPDAGSLVWNSKELLLRGCFLELRTGRDMKNRRSIERRKIQLQSSKDEPNYTYMNKSVGESVGEGFHSP